MDLAKAGTMRRQIAVFAICSCMLPRLASPASQSFARGSGCRPPTVAPEASSRSSIAALLNLSEELCYGSGMRSFAFLLLRRHDGA